MSRHGFRDILLGGVRSAAAVSQSVKLEFVCFLDLGGRRGPHNLSQRHHAITGRGGEFVGVIFCVGRVLALNKRNTES